MHIIISLIEFYKCLKNTKLYKRYYIKDNTDYYSIKEKNINW